MDQAHLVLETNIFFYITSVAVVIVTVLVAIGLYYIIGILRNIRDVSDRVRRGSEQFAEDVNEFREAIKEDGATVRHIFALIMRGAGWFPSPAKKRGTRRKSAKAEGVEEESEA
jgi:hypothetical protein